MTRESRGLTLPLTPLKRSMPYAAFGQRDYHVAYAAYTELLDRSDDCHAEALTNRSLVACKLGSYLRNDFGSHAFEAMVLAIC